MTEDKIKAETARLEEEKAILWEIIHGLEDWMHGEGCLVSPRIKVKLDIARTLMAPVKEDTHRYRKRLFDCYHEPEKQPKPDMRKRPKTPEEKQKQSQTMKKYWSDNATNKSEVEEK